MNERKRLGRGLAALISEVESSDEINADDFNKLSKSFYLIPIDSIIANPSQPRKNFAEEELIDLAESIRVQGILQPILLKPVDIDGKYQIIAGERRWRAAKIAKLEHIPAIIKNVENNAALEIAIIENIQRENLNPIEEANGYNQLISIYNYTHIDLSEKLGKSRSHITNSLRLLNLSEKMQNMVALNQLSSGHARVLLSVENPEFLAHQIIEKKLSVRETEQLRKDMFVQKDTAKNNIDKYKESKVKKLKNYTGSTSFTKDTDILNIEKILQETLKLKVEIVETQDGAQLKIDFQTLQELDNLIQLLTVNAIL